jgi:prepilin-type N-terminal cleavage/methylation domain-containing protein
MHRPNGFSLIELLIAVGIILIIAAIAIPNLLRARMSANEASAVSSLRTINTAMIAYDLSYPTVGFASSLSKLGSTPCHPDATTPCLIDGVLAAGTKSGYNFAAAGSGGPPATKYLATAVPISINQTGINSFCSVADATIRWDSTGALPGSDVACQASSPMGGASSGGSGGGGGGGGGGGNGNGNNGNGNGNGGGNGSNGGGNGNGNSGNGNGNGGPK